MLGVLMGIGGGSACHGCHADGPCDRDLCVCEDVDGCGFECAVDGCVGICNRLDTCDAACPDGCALECTDASQCTLGCDDDCVVECARVSACDVECGERCDVECSDAGDCDVRMVSGTVRCERVGGCNVACIADDRTEPAIDCGDGLFACGAC